jgi:hypothetical protein
VARLITLSRDLPLLTLPLDALNLAYTQYTLNMRQFVTHYHAVTNANLDHPILLSEDGEIFDGRHRIMRALSLGHKTISAKRFDKNPIPDRIEA